jgi:hypothetical protein
MKKIIIGAGVISILFYAACSDNTNSQVQALEGRVAELEKNAYVPGFGEFMNTIQLHHAKLWFAGNAQNWELAQYEADEMKETFDDLEDYVTGRREVQQIPMIRPALDSISHSIAAKDQKRFQSAYILLTNTCNNCHQATGHAYNHITIPVGSPVTDQQLKPEARK